MAGPVEQASLGFAGSSVSVSELPTEHVLNMQDM